MGWGDTGEARDVVLARGQHSCVVHWGCLHSCCVHWGRTAESWWGLGEEAEGWGHTRCHMAPKKVPCELMIWGVSV